MATKRVVSEQLLEKARLYVRRFFARYMPGHLYFHDLEHTLAVTRTAVGLGQMIGVPVQDVAILELAALFHDTGYARTYAGHEAESVKIAESYLKKQKLPKAQIDEVAALIIATTYSAQPRTRLEKILRDADSAKAGQADFGEKAEKLRRELSVVRRKKLGGRSWLLENIEYLKAHQFHTPQARSRFEKQKKINLIELERQASIEGRVTTPEIVNEKFYDRDLSWLSFNDRVLQEARDQRVPLLERFKFLAIYSSNLDEFYRVRVASLRSLTKLKRTDRTALDVTPAKLVDKINHKALQQQKEFGKLYRGTLLPALRKEGVRILQLEELSPLQKKFLKEHFKKHIQPLLNTAVARSGNAPFIEDRKLYFACKLKPKSGSKGGPGTRIVLINIPSTELGRFVVLPGPKGKVDILFLDDAVRIGLPQLFPDHKLEGCHSIKLSRDAELYLDEEFTGNVKEKVKRSLKKRHTGVPSRFLYDEGMPKGTLRLLRQVLVLKKQDVVPGGRYHHLSDLIKLPVPDRADLRDPIWPPIEHPAMAAKDPFRYVAQKDVLLHFPYHDFSGFIRFLQRAAADKQVTKIQITLYRVAQGSAVCAALLDALHNGKEVTVFVEVQARFDEDSNLFWGEALENAGARVLYSHEGLKVHCKLCQIERLEKRRKVLYTYLGTGNFNERTAKIYTDMAILTVNEQIGREVSEIFTNLQDREHRPKLDHLLMAPLTMRSRIEAAIDREITIARSGGKASILLKLNSLEDHAMIRKFYDADQAGVKVRIIVRGICCLIPGLPAMSRNIEAISIIDRFLEHTRVFVFNNGGRPLTYLASADLMGRNLDRRVEVAFPVLDADLKKHINELLELQWNDTVKARRIDVEQSNQYVSLKEGDDAVRAQEATYFRLKNNDVKKKARRKIQRA
jgi:polyphosphate kinase